MLIDIPTIQMPLYLYIELTEFNTIYMWILKKGLFFYRLEYQLATDLPIIIYNNKSLMLTRYAKSQKSNIKSFYLPYRVVQKSSPY